MNETKKRKKNNEPGEFSLLIKTLRGSHGLTMSEAARLANMASPQLWSAYECGKRAPTIAQANRILGVFNMFISFSTITHSPGASTKSVGSTKKI